VPPSNNLAGQSVLPLPTYQLQARLLTPAQPVMHAQCQAAPPSAAPPSAAAAAAVTVPVSSPPLLQQEHESEGVPVCSQPAAGPAPVPTGDLLVGCRVEIWSQLDSTWFGARVEVRTGTSGWATEFGSFTLLGSKTRHLGIWSPMVGPALVLGRRIKS
jgi:hypothetical protein